MNLDQEILNNQKKENKQKEMAFAAQQRDQLKQKAQHKDNCMWHSLQRFKERMGRSIGYDELAGMAQLIQEGRSVDIRNDQHLLRYGNYILRLVYCPMLRAVKSVLPVRDLASLLASVVPRSELHKLVSNKSPCKRH